jgi:demethylmenaquinone methyltransferase/2-methoxy-6-polyprenyl-1,4-benzoquinol methylase
MFDAIAPRYDMVNRIMTFRLDVRWRRKAVRDLALSPGSVVLDLASGTGDLCIDLRRAGLTPISIPDGAVDGIICGFALRNLVDLDQFFAECARAIRPGGRVALLDVGVPHNPIIRFGNNIYFGKIVPKIGALLSDGPAYRYLPKSVAYLPERHILVEKLRNAGFADATHHQLSGGLTQLMVGTRSA